MPVSRSLVGTGTSTPHLGTAAALADGWVPGGSLRGWGYCSTAAADFLAGVAMVGLHASRLQLRPDSTFRPRR